MSSPYDPQGYPQQPGTGGYAPLGGPETPPQQPGYAPPPPPPGYAAPAAPGYGNPAAHGYAPQPEIDPATVFPPQAGWGARALASLVDTVLAVAIWAVCFYGTMFLAIWLIDPNNHPEREYMMAFVMIPLIPVSLFLAFCYAWIPHARSGRTLGKRMTGIKVIRMKTGRQPSFGISAGRQLVTLGLGSATCIGLLVDLLWPLWDEPYRQAVHDKAVGTRVIKVRGVAADAYTAQHPAAAGPPAGHPGQHGQPGPGGWY